MIFSEFPLEPNAVRTAVLKNRIVPNKGKNIAGLDTLLPKKAKELNFSYIEKEDILRRPGKWIVAEGKQYTSGRSELEIGFFYNPQESLQEIAIKQGGSNINISDSHVSGMDDKCAWGFSRKPDGKLDFHFSEIAQYPNDKYSVHHLHQHQKQLMAKSGFHPSLLEAMYAFNNQSDIGSSRNNIKIIINGIASLFENIAGTAFFLAGTDVNNVPAQIVGGIVAADSFRRLVAPQFQNLASSGRAEEYKNEMQVARELGDYKSILRVLAWSLNPWFISELKKKK